MWYGLQDMVRKGSHQLRQHEFWALSDINLTVRPGQAVGLVGRNGSGKTTLMRMISGLLPPTMGAVHVSGKVTPVFRLRSGMHPHYTGRDYVYIQGAMHGMDKARIDEKFDTILDFSALHDFIDAPVGTYSSGMKARLGYSVAVVSDFDLLIIDEALAVGDTAFREKCIEHLKVVSREKALIFVSHNLDMIRDISNTLVIMDKGQIREVTYDVEQGLARYKNDSRAIPRKIVHPVPQPRTPVSNMPRHPLPHQLQLISLHIPKTAGTSFRHVLEQVYGDRLAKLDIRNDQLLLNDRLFLGQSLPENIHVIHGHFFYNNLRKALALEGKQIPVITWLRDPVERVISNYYYLSATLARALDEESRGLNLRNKMQRSLLEFAATDFARNRMARFLSGIPLKSLFFVGIVEQYEEDLALLSRKLSWPRIKPQQLNTTGKVKMEVSAAERATIADLNREDVALYHEALALRGIRQ